MDGISTGISTDGEHERTYGLFCTYPQGSHSPHRATRPYWLLGIIGLMGLIGRMGLIERTGLQTQGLPTNARA